MKIGIIFEGGASRTYFSCGVIDALLDEKIYADYVIGVSAGISFGVSYCSRQKERNLRILEQYEEKGIYQGFHHMFRKSNKSYYNLDFVFGEVPNKLVPFDFEAFKNHEGDCLAVVTNIDTGLPEYIPVIPDDKCFTALRATCAIPILFQPVEINGKYYLDGGMSDSIPFDKAFEDGCDKVIAVLTRPRGYRKSKESTTSIINLKYKKYPKLMESFKNRPETYNKQIERLEALEKEGKALLLAPEETFGIGRFEKRKAKLIPFYRYGYDYAMRNMEKIKEFIKG